MGQLRHILAWKSTFVEMLRVRPELNLKKDFISLIFPNISSVVYSTEKFNLKDLSQIYLQSRRSIYAQEVQRF